MLSAIDRNHCPQSIGIPVRNRRNPQLVREIAKSDKDAVIITDKIKDTPNVFNFQKMKGQNEFRNSDVYIVVQALAPAKYAELNVIGQWLGISDIISEYYFDQINQAVGRNRGFRQSMSKDTKTVVITTNRLWKQVLGNPRNGTSRVLLYESYEFHWNPPVKAVS
jgi:hypothetical protein